MLSNNLMSIENLKFSYKKDSILNIENIEIPKSKIITIVGPSGSGKTTLLKIIAGLLNSDTASFNYSDYFSKSNIGFVFQDSQLYEQISVKKNIFLSAYNSIEFQLSFLEDRYLNFLNKNKLKSINEIEKMFENKFSVISKNSNNLLLIFKIKLLFLLSKKLAKKPKLIFKFIAEIKIKKNINERIEEILKILGIHNIKNKKANELSGGQKQRVAIAKSLIKNAKLLIMDEPFASLDENIKEEAKKFISSIQKQFGFTLLLVTHDQNDAIELSDKILVMNQGKILQQDSPEIIYEKPITEFVAKFIGKPEIVQLKKNENGSEYIRSNHINIEPNITGKYSVIQTKNLGPIKRFKISNDEFEFFYISSNLNLKEGDNVDVFFDNSKILKYDKLGNLINA
ncbi:glycerol ABC transporter ATP-binding protein [Mycoplasma testudineum]|uniref:Glycerol ABC transporter ATP-binding protein n=1 Tax=Mycoplasma testudineum TaxID=244584 RepID=A0A4R6IC92_9MOLU|nr:ABC transporter ATP-binding protein [Mycoplasma testudineum]OYD26618.1 hypothetical protein CG473_03220 [Mycoplasma testudineum]TDO19454.1 glycerol ABC transporter ATP-binding protein [Mycoplasma testudineum]